MPFKPEPNMVSELQKAPELARFLHDVAAEVSAETEQRAPDWIKQRGAEFTSDVRTGDDGREGHAEVVSPFWHIHEYGSMNNPPQPYIRPSAVKVLAKHGGRLEERGR